MALVIWWFGIGGILMLIGTIWDLYFYGNSNGDCLTEKRLIFYLLLGPFILIPLFRAVYKLLKRRIGGRALFGYTMMVLVFAIIILHGLWKGGLLW